MDCGLKLKANTLGSIEGSHEREIIVTELFTLNVPI